MGHKFSGQVAYLTRFTTEPSLTLYLLPYSGDCVIYMLVLIVLKYRPLAFLTIQNLKYNYC